MTYVVEIKGLEQTKLWKQYVAIDYGRAIPEKGYKGFKSFLEDITKATRVEGKPTIGYKLYFENDNSYTWFLLRWA